MNKLLTTADVAKYLGISTGTVENWRYLCTGPAYIKIKGSVRYEESELINYIQKQKNTTNETRSKSFYSEPSAEPSPKAGIESSTAISGVRRPDIA